MRSWLHTVSVVLVVVGALNWGLVGLAEVDLVAEIVGEEFGETNAVSRAVYIVVGLAGLVLAAERAMPGRQVPAWQAAEEPARQRP